MKQSLPIFCLLLWGACASATPAYVASSYTQNVAATCNNSCNLQLAVTATSGAIIFASGIWGSPSGTTVLSSLTGTNGSCTALAGTAWQDTVNQYAGESGYCVVGAGATYTVTFNLNSGGGTTILQELEVTGQGGSPINVSNFAENQNCGSSTCTCPSLTTTVANTLVVCLMADYPAGSITFSSASGTFVGSTGTLGAGQYLAESSTGTYAPTFGMSANNATGGGFAVAIAPSGGAGGGNSLTLLGVGE